MSLFLVLVTLAAQAAQAAEPEPYRALGRSPLWLVHIGAESMRFEANGRQTITMETPPRQETELGFAHSSPELSVSVEHRDCRDPLTGRTFSDSVTVDVGAQRFEGCGGAVVREAPED